MTLVTSDGERVSTSTAALRHAGSGWDLGPDDDIELSWKDAWRNELRGHHGEWVKDPVEALAGYGHPGQKTAVSDARSRAAVGDLMRTSAASVPGMFGGNTHLDWDGKPPTLFPDASNPLLLADVDWKGHVSIAQSVAETLADDKGGGPIDDTNAYTVPFHEMIHAVVPEGESRNTNGDRQAYQNYPSSQIEEGFTELGMIQHAADFFDQAGVGDRPVLDKGSLAKQRLLAELNGLPFTPDTTASKTMDDLAAERSAPAAIRRGKAWGHYKHQAAQAYDWVSTIAQMHTGKGEDDQATQDEILRMSDEINAVGTAAKPRVMAQHVIADMELDAKTRESVLDSTSTSLLDEWGKGNIQQAVAQARRAAVQRVQALQAERAAT
jgi:hypothetical protein